MQIYCINGCEAYTEGLSKEQVKVEEERVSGEEGWKRTTVLNEQSFSFISNQDDINYPQHLFLVILSFGKRKVKFQVILVQ